jgi:hypothetical protein
MKNAFWIRALLALTLAALPLPALAQTGDCSAVAGWKQKGEPRSFEPDNLFDYIDGNAEAYLLYRFVGMKGVTCVAGDVTVVIDVSELADPEYAFGIFSANRDPRKPVEKIGMAGQVLPRKATFAKDRFYVEVAANPEGDHSQTLRQFALDIEKRIQGRTAQPEALGWFPTEGLVAGSVRLIPESVLGIRLLTRGYVGQYEFGKGFVVASESPEAAIRLMAKLRERFGQTSAATVGDEAFTATDRYLDGICLFRKGKYVGGFSNLKGRDGVREAATLVARIP